MRRKSGVEKKMQITYQNEWEYTNIHVDLPIPYEEDYQIKMIHYNKIKGMLPVQGIGRDGQSRYTSVSYTHLHMYFTNLFFRYFL